jgi:hypothetical protein
VSSAVDFYLCIQKNGEGYTFYKEKGISLLFKNVLEAARKIAQEI